MKTPSLLCTFALAGALSLGATARSHADDTAITITLPTGTVLVGNNPGLSFGDLTLTGSFRFSDGTSGTYKETHSYDFGTGTGTDTIVYTLADGSATSTDTTVDTLHADYSRTVVYTHFAFGATAAFTSTTTFPVVTTTTTKPNGSTNTSTGASRYGTGTFIAADGTTGTLTTFATSGGVQTTVTSTDYTSAAGLTRELRTVRPNGFRLSENILSVGPTGTLTTTTRNRIPDRHNH